MLVELVNRYNEENTDGITVEMDISSDFDSQLSTAFAAGTGPTMILSSSAYRFTYGDYMQDISDVFDKTNLDKSDFIQSYLDYCSEGDALYFVPFQVVGYYMYWNKDLFEAAGLDPETPPTTWDEWQTMAEQITDESKNVYGSGISYDYAYQIAHIIQRFGGLAVTDNNGTWQANFEGNDGYADFLTMYKDMVSEGVNPLEADTDSMASAGQIGIYIGGPWVTAGLDTAGVNYGIGLIPQGAAGDMNSVEVLGFSVTTAASDAEKEAAYKFIEWWNTEDSEGSSPALEWSVANGFPAYTYSVQEKDAYKESAKLSAMSQANPDAPTDFIVDSSFPGINSIISDVIPEMINAAAFGDDSVEDILSKAQASADAIVDQYN
jgi:multiple sugar transport system substrate-binding protein